MFSPGFQPVVYVLQVCRLCSINDHHQQDDEKKPVKLDALFHDENSAKWQFLGCWLGSRWQFVKNREIYVKFCKLLSLLRSYYLTNNNSFFGINKFCGNLRFAYRKCLLFPLHLFTNVKKLIPELSNVFLTRMSLFLLAAHGQ